MHRSREGKIAVVTIRRAKLKDVEQVAEIISGYAKLRVLLPRPSAELYESVREFAVAEDEGKILGCAALRFYTPSMGEIRSLAVAPGRQGNGVGRRLIEFLLAEAAEHELKQVFALTLIPEYFKNSGFGGIPLEALPMKVWRDCLQCEKFFQCDEKAVVYFLDKKYAERFAEEKMLLRA